MPSRPMSEFSENDLADIDLPASATEYATHGAGRKLRSELPHLRLVAPLRPERASRGFFAVVITALLAFGLVMMLVINTSVAQTAFTVSELKIQQRDLSRAEAALTKALAEAASPPVLEAKARSLGMIPSDRAVFLTVPSGKVRGKAKPAPGNRARGVDDRQRAIAVGGVRHCLVGTDVLGDAARFTADHIGLADGIEQFGLAVIDVTHDRDDRWTRHQIRVVAFVLTELKVEGLQQLPVLVFG